MLAELDIRDFAIVDRLRVALLPGLNVITGETGAGKSIVIDAVSSILGGKTAAEYLRTGSDQAHVEGVFALTEQEANDELLAVLADHGLAIEDGTLILSRDLYRSGRTVARVNGRAVPVTVLQQIGQSLVDIHGQSEHLSLLRPAYQLDLLDDYAGALDSKAKVSSSLAVLRGVRREMERLSADERELARRADLLRFQVEEIAAARLVPGEEEDLRQERTLLANAEKLAASADTAYRALYADENETASALDRLGEAEGALLELAKLDPSLQAYAEAVSGAVYQVDEAGRAMRAYRDAVEFNPTRLQEIEERLDLIQSLKRKYANSIEEVLEFGKRASAELDSLVHSEERRTELRAEEEEQLRQTGQLAAELSAKRQQAASALGAAIEAELLDLQMKGAKFSVLIEQAPDPTGVPLSAGLEGQRFACDSTGVDRVTFLISPNPGEPLKPLAKIASGGEMSRLLLALKTVLSRSDRIGTLIFDEVDVGVGGRGGKVIGEKLAGLSRRHQVLCVTHLPQVASFADSHFRIAKVVSEGRTSTSVTRLPEAERIDEIAAMMAGANITPSARQSAAELLHDATTWKEQARVATATGARDAAGRDLNNV